MHIFTHYNSSHVYKCQRISYTSFKKFPPDEQVRDMRWLDETVHPKPSSWRLPCLLEIFSQVIERAAAVSAEIVTHYDCAFHPESTHCTWPAFATQHACESTIGLYRENAIAVRIIDRSAYDAASRVHAHRQRKNMSYLRNGCCIYYLRPTGSAHL